MAGPSFGRAPAPGDLVVATGAPGPQGLPGTLPSPLVGPIQGVTDGSNAAAGMVGEYIASSSPIGGGINFAGNTGSVSVASINITPGDWTVGAWYYVTFNYSSGVSAPNALVVGMLGSGTLGVILPGLQSVRAYAYPNDYSSNALIAGGTMGPTRFVNTSQQTAYFWLNTGGFPAGFTGCNVSYELWARRMR